MTNKEKLVEVTINSLQNKLNEDDNEETINLKDYPEITNLLNSNYAKFKDLQKVFNKLFSGKDEDLINQVEDLINEADWQLKDFMRNNDLDYKDNNMYMEENHLVSVIVDKLQEYLDEDRDIYIDTDFSDEMHS